MVEMKIIESVIAALKEDYLCDNCLGRLNAGLLSGYSNEQRGKIMREFLAFLIDSGEKIEVNNSNFYGMKFRNLKLKPENPGRCRICNNFFIEDLEKMARRVVKNLDGIEFNTFLIGTKLTDEMQKEEEKFWEKTDIEFTEPIKSEINREIGKIVERITGKKFDQKNPDVTMVVNLKTKKIKPEVRSLYIFGGYKKLVRGIPQAKWVCLKCRGRGCKNCKGKGKLYPTSVQEIIEKPMLKMVGSDSSKFSGMGREDIDARCLDYRPFVIEIVKPLKRSIDVKGIEKKINKSNKVNVKGLRSTAKDMIRKIKFAKIDKTYLAVVDFKKKIDRKKLKELKKIVGTPILQKTPLRVVHRRADKFRKRMVKRMIWRLVKGKRMEFKITGETGLYIKELITGDEGRTQPNISDILDDKIKKISLDVIKFDKSVVRLNRKKI